MSAGLREQLLREGFAIARDNVKLDEDGWSTAPRIGWCNAEAALEAAVQTPPPGFERRFPIQDGPSVPWGAIALHEGQAQRNHHQSLDQLAARGGLACAEAVAVLEDRAWRPMDGDEALARLKYLAQGRYLPKEDLELVENAIVELLDALYEEVARRPLHERTATTRLVQADAQARGALAILRGKK